MLNVIDLSMIVVLTLSTILGFLSGFISSVLSLVRMVASVFIAFALQKYVSAYLSAYIKTQVILHYISFIATYIFVMFVLSVIRYMLVRKLGDIKHSPMDLCLGTIFGFIRGMIILCFVFLSWMIAIGAIDITIDNNQAEMTESQTTSKPEALTGASSYDFLMSATHMVVDIVPISWIKYLLNKIGNQANDSIDSPSDTPHQDDSTTDTSGGQYTKEGSKDGSKEVSVSNMHDAIKNLPAEDKKKMFEFFTDYVNTNKK